MATTQTKRYRVTASMRRSESSSWHQVSWRVRVVITDKKTKEKTAFKHAGSVCKKPGADVFYWWCSEEKNYWPHHNSIGSNQTFATREEAFAHMLAYFAHHIEQY